MAKYSGRCEFANTADSEPGCGTIVEAEVTTMNQGAIIMVSVRCHGCGKMVRLKELA